VSVHKWSFCPISALCLKNNPRNTQCIPAVIFFACLDLEQKFSFLDGHYLRKWGQSMIFEKIEAEVSPKLKNNYHATMRSSMSMKYFFKDLG